MPVAFPRDFRDQDGVFLPTGASAAFAYSDGDVIERYIHDAILKCNDRTTSSLELESHIRDWPSLYHLSRKRSNLLRPLDLARCQQVLEIGCGCGAITRYLAETCGHVTAIEGSPRRLAIARARCEGLTNVTFVCANFDDIVFDPVFDLVTSIGVWEYAGAYLSGTGDPWARFLERARAPLSREGRLLIAIENQFGLKYFAGEDEDHTGRPYEGLEGYYGTRVRTFGRPTIERALASVGLVSRWYLPYPDYKLPKVVIDAEVPADVSVAQWCDATASPRHMADPLVRPELERNGLLAPMSNSFLIEAAASTEALGRRPWQVASFALHRARRFQTETRMMRGASGHYEITKRPLFPEAAATPNPLLTQRLDPAAVVEGEKLSLELLRAWRAGGAAGRAAFRERVVEWHAFLMQHASKDGREQLPADMVDCTPFNLIRRPDGFALIDREWLDHTGEVTAPWVLFRGLYWFLVEYGVFGPPRYGPGRYGRFLREHASHVGYQWSEAQLVAFAEREVAFQAAVLGEAAGPGETDVATFRQNLKSPRITGRRLKGLARRNAGIAFRGYRKVVRLGERLLTGRDGD